MVILEKAFFRPVERSKSDYNINHTILKRKFNHGEIREK